MERAGTIPARLKSITSVSINRNSRHPKYQASDLGGQ
jgi:hypothetical protein